VGEGAIWSESLFEDMARQVSGAVRGRGVGHTHFLQFIDNGVDFIGGIGVHVKAAQGHVNGFRSDILGGFGEIFDAGMGAAGEEYPAVGGFDTKGMLRDGVVVQGAGSTSAGAQFGGFIRYDRLGVLGQLLQERLGASIRKINGQAGMGLEKRF